MKRFLTTLSATCLVLSAAALADTSATATTTSTATTASADTNTVSYALGYKTGEAMKERTVAINTQQFSQGLQDGYTGQKPSVSEADMRTALTNMQQQIVQNMQQKMEQAATKNAAEGQAFLAKNAKESGVVTTASGLQYKILDQGNGASPAAHDTVVVNYEGKLINGDIFDSSYEHGKPATFTVNQVIKGWQEALTMMKPGATWMIYIPSNLAYGSQGAVGAIGPNETLIFKVNLISVKKA